MQNGFKNTLREIETDLGGGARNEERATPGYDPREEVLPRAHGEHVQTLVRERLLAVGVDPCPAVGARWFGVQGLRVLIEIAHCT